MKPFVLASPVSIKCSSVLLVLALLELLSINLGCSLSAKPSKSVETLCRTVDSVSADSDSQANEPSHPESAVEDVVKWARDAGASSLKNWLAKQPSPAVCKAPLVDRATLPDEVKYHDVDDPKVRERLLSALD